MEQDEHHFPPTKAEVVSCTGLGLGSLLMIMVRKEGVGFFFFSFKWAFEGALEKKFITHGVNISYLSSRLFRA